MVVGRDARVQSCESHLGQSGEWQDDCGSVHVGKGFTVKWGLPHGITGKTRKSGITPSFLGLPALLNTVQNSASSARPRPRSSQREGKYPC